MLRVSLQLGELLNFVLQTSLSVCLPFQPAAQQYASDQSNHREVFAAWLRNICLLQGSHCRSAWLGLLAIIFPVTAINLQQPFTTSLESLPHDWLLVADQSLGQCDLVQGPWTLSNFQNIAQVNVFSGHKSGQNATFSLLTFLCFLKFKNFRLKCKNKFHLSMFNVTVSVLLFISF